MAMEMLRFGSNLSSPFSETEGGKKDWPVGKLVPFCSGEEE